MDEDQFAPFGFTPAFGRQPMPMGADSVITDPTYLQQLAILSQLQQPTSFAPQQFAPLGSGLMGQQQGMGMAPTIGDWRNFRPAPVAPAATPPDMGGGGGDYGTASSGGMGTVGQGVNNQLANLGLNLMLFPSFTTPGAIGRGIADAQINAMDQAYSNLAEDQGLLGSISSGGGGVVTVSDVNGNTFTFSSPETIADYDAATFAPTPTESLMDAIAATPGGSEAMATGMATNAAGQTVSNNATIGAQNADMGGISTSVGVGDVGSAASTGMTDVGGLSVSNDASIAAQDAATFGDTSSGGGGVGGKIVCTAMNQAYGFGGFRQAIWLRYSADHMTKAHEAGYHAMFLPLVDAAYKHTQWYSKPLRKALENIARHRTADLRAEMRGTKRDTLGRFYRSIFEPLCYAVGKLKGY